MPLHRHLIPQPMSSECRRERASSIPGLCSRKEAKVGKSNNQSRQHLLTLSNAQVNNYISITVITDRQFKVIHVTSNSDLTRARLPYLLAHPLRPGRPRNQRCSSDCVPLSRAQSQAFSCVFNSRDLAARVGM